MTARKARQRQGPGTPAVPADVPETAADEPVSAPSGAPPSDGADTAPVSTQTASAVVPPGDSGSSTDVATAPPVKPPVTKHVIAKPEPQRAGGFILTERGWEIEKHDAEDSGS